jgi:hypothetical protein
MLGAFAAVACGGGDDGSSASDDGNPNFAACGLLTRADATALFEAPAEPEAGPIVTDPDYIGDCSYAYETPDGLGRQLLALNVWGDVSYYAPGPNAEPFDIGDQGSVVSGAGTGVDVSWTQGDITASLGYFTIGEGVPDHLAKLDEVKALASKVADRI